MQFCLALKLQAQDVPTERGPAIEKVYQKTVPTGRIDYYKISSSSFE